MSGDDLSQFSMLDLFRVEVDNHTHALTAGLLALERDATAADHLEDCMRAAHSIKGAARIIDLTPGVDVAHAMEECFVAAQKGSLILRQNQIDALLHGVDLLSTVASTAETAPDATRQAVDTFIEALRQSLATQEDQDAPAELIPPSARVASSGGDTADRMLRVTADSLNQLLSLAGESLMATRRLGPFTDGLLQLKRLHRDAAKAFDQLRETLPPHAVDVETTAAVTEMHERIGACQKALSQRLAEFESLDRHATSLARRLYDEALACRMRPFEDGVRWYARIVRDIGRALGKQVRLEILGGATAVDRDILDKLDAPLGHLLRNAVDHGIETAEERRSAGKPAEGVVQLEARHAAGRLQITVADDGCGIDRDRLRRAIVARNLVNEETAVQLSDVELLEFLFLPGFTMKGTVTTMSGRGVGLDAVRAMVKQVGGITRVVSQPGQGARIQLQLPLTLSVMRTLLVEVDGEPYAFPLAGIVRALRLPREHIQQVEGRQYFTFEGRRIGLVAAHQVLTGRAPTSASEDVSVVVVGDQQNAYGVVADRFLDECELVVQPLDARLGKIMGISAGAVMEDGSPVLILDIEDMIRSIEKISTFGSLGTLRSNVPDPEKKPHKRILVVDDSLTVRELERKLLTRHGYDVEVAVDGVDGWNAMRTGHFDLVVTDVDMPRMGGIELVGLIRADQGMRTRPVMIVSYKDSEEDRHRGLEAGADYYLTKGSFHDERLVQAVVDLIGEAEG